MKYGKHFQTKETPQSEAIPGSTQVPNSAGGYSFAVDEWIRLERFLILGSEGGSYYASEKKLSKENAKTALECIKKDGRRVVDTVVDISHGGRAPKNDAAVFILAMAAGLGDLSTRQYAFARLSEVCRIGTHLFQFVEAYQGFKGWSRSSRNGVANWYLSKKPDQLALQLAKYQQRDGWSHRDLLRLSHPKAKDHEIFNLLAWTAGKGKEGTEYPKIIDGLTKAMAQPDAKAKTAAQIVSEYSLPRECVPTEWLAYPEVWDAMLPTMGLTALIRNLGNMSRIGLIIPMSDAAKAVVKRIGNEDDLKKSRVHPLQILLAQSQYNSGHGLRGKGLWNPVPQIVGALDNAFYASFKNVEPTGKRWYLGIDVSGSMSCGSVAGTSLTPREASSAMAMVTVHTEEDYYSAAFQDTMRKLTLTKGQRLDDICKMTMVMPFGGTNCSLPMLDALEKKIKADVFVVYTDSETWAGRMHPVQALKQYRDKMGIPAKLIVVGMVSNGFSIADPKDVGMLDVVGFDTATPHVMADFVKN
jgi:60 kDa SS-A/Ro ribonucleoprotein